MKIAIPLAGGRLCQHFGHCEQFALIDADPDKKEISASQTVTPPAHEPGVLPRWLSDQGADLVIAGGMGNRAQTLFAEAGIRVVVGAANSNPEDLVMAFLDQSMQLGENPCDH